MSAKLADSGDALATVNVQFKAITQQLTQEQERLDMERRRIFRETRDDWRESTGDAHIVSQPVSRKLQKKHLVTVRAIVNLNQERPVRDVYYDLQYDEDEVDVRWGPYSTWRGVWIFKGTYVCVLADEEAAVLACAHKFYGPTAEQVKRASARLRALAGREGLKASIRDTTVTLKSPMGDVVHEGDITSAYLWLCGIDCEVPDRITYWESDYKKEQTA